MPNNLTVIVLAAGGGTRMKSKTMKVLHPLAGRSMIGHVLAAVQALEPQRIVAVVGTQREHVAPHIQELVPDAVLAVQETQEGTGHAVRIAMDAVGDVTGTVVVLAADTPLIEGETLRGLAEEHEAAERAVSILSGRVANPFGYGRILRNAEGDVEAIIEEKDATREQQAINEINSGIIAFDAAFLTAALPKLDNDNAKSEYYLTDIVTRWMKDGVTVMDPATTWIESEVVLSRDVTLLPNTQLLGATVVGEDAVVGPDTTLKDCEIGEGAHVVRTHGELAVIGAGSNVGPYAYLRPGTQLGVKGKIGTFVETKNAQIGAGAKVPHLSYVGDAEIGEATNIGAGTIFANYDGVKKSKTVVGRHARTGSNNTFVAPVTIGDGASTGGGTVVRRDVPPGSLAVSGGPQRNLEGWALAKRAGTPQAEAAESALAATDVSSHGEPSVSDE